MRFIILREIAFILSFPTPDQVEGDTKDTVYQTAGIALSRKDGIPNQVGNDIMNKFQSDSGSSTGMT
jgi:hypothetical protein